MTKFLLIQPLKVLKGLAWPIGIWPLSDGLFSKFRSFISIFMQISVFMCVTIELTLGCFNSEEVIEMIELQNFGIISALKVLLVRSHHKDMARIIFSTIEDWFSPRKPKFLEIMKTYANLGNWIFYCQLTTIVCAMYFLILDNWPSLTPTEDSNWTNNSDAILFHRTFPLKTKCLFRNVSPSAYIFIYFLQVLQIASIPFGNAGIDIIFFILAMHVSGQLEILNQEMSAVVEEGDLKMIKMKIIALGQRYQDLLEDARRLERIFSSIILIQLIVNVSGISFYEFYQFLLYSWIMKCYPFLLNTIWIEMDGIVRNKRIQTLIIIRNKGILAGLYPFSAVEILLVQLFLYCYAGDLLSEKLKMFSFANYENCWYNLPNNLAKDVYFIMIMTAQPYKLTAGNFMIMNLVSFCRLVKTTASYFSVLRLMLNT